MSNEYSCFVRCWQDQPHRRRDCSNKTIISMWMRNNKRDASVLRNVLIEIILRRMTVFENWSIYEKFYWCVYIHCNKSNKCSGHAIIHAMNIEKFFRDLEDKTMRKHMMRWSSFFPRFDNCDRVCISTSFIRRYLDDISRQESISASKDLSINWMNDILLFVYH